MCGEELCQKFNDRFLYISDPAHPFVDHNYVEKNFYDNTLNLTKGKKGVFPCRTSNPMYEVAFISNNYPPVAYGPEDGVTFDPKEGVIVDNAGDFNGVFACEVSVTINKMEKLFVRSWRTNIEG